MKNRRKATIVGFLSVAVCLAYLLPKAYNPIDGWSFLSLIFHEDTEYAEGYSDTAFQGITKGMTRSQVINALGEPLVYWDYGDDKQNNRRRLSYSRSPGDTHYRIRTIVVKDDRVEEKRVEFWVD